MPRSQKHQSLSQYLEKLELALKEKRYVDGLLLAINAYHTSRDIECEALETTSLAYMGKALEQLGALRRAGNAALSKARESCSFCGKNRSAVRMMGGAEANICEECAARVHVFFSKRGKAQSTR
jgi:hypothetical protein